MITGTGKNQAHLERNVALHQAVRVTQQDYFCYSSGFPPWSWPRVLRALSSLCPRRAAILPVQPIGVNTQSHSCAVGSSMINQRLYRHCFSFLFWSFSLYHSYNVTEGIFVSASAFEGSLMSYGTISFRAQESNGLDSQRWTAQFSRRKNKDLF